MVGDGAFFCLIGDLNDLGSGNCRVVVGNAADTDKAVSGRNDAAVFADGCIVCSRIRREHAVGIVAGFDRPNGGHIRKRDFTDNRKLILGGSVGLLDKVRAGDLHIKLVVIDGNLEGLGIHIIVFGGCGYYNFTVLDRRKSTGLGIDGGNVRVVNRPSNGSVGNAFVLRKLDGVRNGFAVDEVEGFADDIIVERSEFLRNRVRNGSGQKTGLFIVCSGCFLAVNRYFGVRSKAVAGAGFRRKGDGCGIRYQFLETSVYESRAPGDGRLFADTGGFGNGGRSDLTGNRSGKTGELHSLGGKRLSRNEVETADSDGAVCFLERVKARITDGIRPQLVLVGLDEFERIAIRRDFGNGTFHVSATASTFTGTAKEETFVVVADVHFNCTLCVVGGIKDQVHTLVESCRERNLGGSIDSIKAARTFMGYNNAVSVKLRANNGIRYVELVAVALDSEIIVDAENRIKGHIALDGLLAVENVFPLAGGGPTVEVERRIGRCYVFDLGEVECIADNDLNRCQRSGETVCHERKRIGIRFRHIVRNDGKRAGLGDIDLFAECIGVAELVDPRFFFIELPAVAYRCIRVCGSQSGEAVIHITAVRFGIGSACRKVCGCSGRIGYINSLIECKIIHIIGGNKIACRVGINGDAFTVAVAGLVNGEFKLNILPSLGAVDRSIVVKAVVMDADRRIGIRHGDVFAVYLGCVKGNVEV